MELITPGVGLIFWTTITFLILIFLLGKFAWKPILESVETRNKEIEDALILAEKTKKEMEQLQSDNKALIQEARIERDAILKEAREIKNSLISEAKEKAKLEGEKIVSSARETIKNEKVAAVAELKNQVAALSIDIAEKILKKELSTDDKQESMVKTLIAEVNVN